jgi:hypothetical protein
LIALGRRVYREGVLASGQPVKVKVLGDFDAGGTNFTCLQCHRRSGLGSSEGRVRVLPVNGEALYSPRTGVYRGRPAYTDESLSVALQEGLDSAGNRLDPLMPLFNLPPLETRALIAYLKGLSNEFSPGVTGDTLHIATIVAGDVDAAKKAAMLEVLENFFAAKNAETRQQPRRAAAGPFFKEFMYKAYRRWALHTWELQGDGSTWRSQLETLYGRQPVFAVISGIAEQDWSPVHRFCEDMELPCLLPNVGAPAACARENDYYTFYYSQGLELEAKTILSKLGDEFTGRLVLQVYRKGTRGERAAHALVAAQPGGPRCVIRDLIVPKTAAIDAAAIAAQAREAAAVILWLERDDLAALAAFDAPRKGKFLYLSSTLLDGDLSGVPPALRASALLVHPFRLPRDYQQRSLREGAWFRTRSIQVRTETRNI